MSIPEHIPSRLIGTLFVERGLVSESQIHVALEIQRETGQQLGVILVERFGISRQELANVVAEQWAKLGGFAGPEHSESWRRLGDIFVERGFVSDEQLEGALQRQQETGERLGEALVAEGIISRFELAGALAEQMSTAGDADEDGDPRTDDVSEATIFQMPTRVDDERELELSLEAHDTQVESDPAPVFVAFAPTATGYRLVPVSGDVPTRGETIDVPDVGELVVLRAGRSPLPLDERVCVFLERPMTPAFATAVA